MRIPLRLSQCSPFIELSCLMICSDMLVDHTPWQFAFLLFSYKMCKIVGFPGSSVVKDHLPLQETQVWSLGQEDPLEKDMATQFSILAWRIPWAEEPGRLQSMGVAKNQTRLKPLSTGIVLSLRNWTNIKSMVLGSVEPGTTFKLWVLGQITPPIWVSIPLFF